MRHIVITRCRVHQGKMQEFVTAIQRWERTALDTDPAPSSIELLVDAADPSHVMLEARFADATEAGRFHETGLFDVLAEDVLGCSDAEFTAHGFDLFYRAGTEGPHVVFGEE